MKLLDIINDSRIPIPTAIAILLFYILFVILFPLVAVILLAGNKVIMTTMWIFIAFRVLVRMLGLLATPHWILPTGWRTIIMLSVAVIVFFGAGHNFDLAISAMAGVALGDLVPDAILLLGYHLAGLIGWGNPLYYFEKAEKESGLRDMLL